MEGVQLRVFYGQRQRQHLFRSRALYHHHQRHGRLTAPVHGAGIFRLISMSMRCSFVHGTPREPGGKVSRGYGLPYG